MAGHAYIPYWLRVVFVAGVLLPSAAPAQLILIPPTVAPAQTGYYLTPALSVTEVYDDNVFYTPSPRTQDVLTRIRPGLKAGYQSAPLTVEGGYAFDSEIYSRHSELTDAQVRQQGSIELKATPIQVLTLSLPVSYFQTRTPTELNLQTGLAVGRVRAERYTANPAFTYRYDPLTTAKGDYTYENFAQFPFVKFEFRQPRFPHLLLKRYFPFSGNLRWLVRNRRAVRCPSSTLRFRMPAPWPRSSAWPLPQRLRALRRPRRWNCCPSCS